MLADAKCGYKYIKPTSRAIHRFSVERVVWVELANDARVEPFSNLGDEPHSTAGRLINWLGFF